MNNKKKDDELLILSIIAGIFTLFLGFFDLYYSSISLMPIAAQVSIWGAQIILGAFWVLIFAKWKDPNWDYLRKHACWLSVVLTIIIGIHHAVTKEDNQVLIDSKEAAAKDSAK